MATKSKPVKSKRETTSLSRIPARGSNETPLSDFTLMGGKPCGSSKNPTTGGRLSASGGQSGKSLNRSRLKSEHYGMPSGKTISNQSLPPKGAGIATRNSRAAIARVSEKSEHLTNWLYKPIESYRQLFEYMAALIEYDYRKGV